MTFVCVSSSRIMQPVPCLLLGTLCTGTMCALRVQRQACVCVLAEASVLTFFCTCELCHRKFCEGWKLLQCIQHFLRIQNERDDPGIIIGKNQAHIFIMWWTLKGLEERWLRYIKSRIKKLQSLKSKYPDIFFTFKNDCTPGDGVMLVHVNSWQVWLG